RMMKQSGLKFPAEGVSPGKRWTDKLELQNTALGKQVVTTTYTYEGEEVVDGKTLDKIGGSTQIDFGNPPNGVKLTIADQKSTGYILFDNQAGDLVSSKLSMDMSLQIAVGDNELSQNIKTNVDVKVLPEKE